MWLYLKVSVIYQRKPLLCHIVYPEVISGSHKQSLLCTFGLAFWNLIIALESKKKLSDFLCKPRQIARTVNSETLHIIWIFPK